MRRDEPPVRNFRNGFAVCHPPPTRPTRKTTTRPSCLSMAGKRCMPFFVLYRSKGFALLPASQFFQEMAKGGRPTATAQTQVIAAHGCMWYRRRTALDATACCYCFLAVIAIAAAVAAAVVADAARRMVAVQSLRYRQNFWTDLGQQLRSDAPCRCHARIPVIFKRVHWQRCWANDDDGATISNMAAMVPSPARSCSSYLSIRLTILRGKKETAGAALATTDRGPNQLRRAFRRGF
jgi:hypothetical protein